MAIQRDFTFANGDHIFLGEDKDIEFAIYADHGETTPLDVSSWDLIWALRAKDKSPDPPLIEKTSANGINVTGIFNATKALNTQRVVVIVEDTDSYDPTADPPVLLKKGKYRHSLKRMDEGSETVLSYGDFEFGQSTTR